MADTSFSQLVPGFDFLQGLVKNAGAAIPGLNQWVAPTLNPEELEKRIEELRTVQFWLEQNARMLGATIQALEVQRMTLSTLQAMNVPMADLKSSLKAAAPAAAPEPAASSPRKPAARSSRSAKAAPKPAETPAMVDPMQWWSALSQQFTQLASQAMQDGTTDAAKHLASGMVQQSMDAVSNTLRKAAAMPGATAGSANQAGKAAKPPTKRAPRRKT